MAELHVLCAQKQRALLKVIGQRPGSHELLHYLVCDLLSPGLVLCDQGLQDLYESLLELAGEHDSIGVILPEGDAHWAIAAPRPEAC